MRHVFNLRCAFFSPPGHCLYPHPIEPKTEAILSSGGGAANSPPLRRIPLSRRPLLDHADRQSSAGARPRTRRSSETPALPGNGSGLRAKRGTPPPGTGLGPYHREGRTGHCKCCGRFHTTLGQPCSTGNKQVSYCGG